MKSNKLLNNILQISLTFLVSALFAYLTLWFSQSHLNNAASKQAANLEKLAAAILIEDPKRTAQLFRFAGDFEYLSITNNNNDVYYRYIKHPSELKWLYLLLKKWRFLPAPQNITFEQFNVEFKLSHDNTIYMLQFLLLLMVAIPWFVLICIKIFYQVSKSHRTYRENALIRLIHFNEDNVVISEQIKQAIQSKVTEQNHFENSPNSYDPVTGMRTGEQFTIDYPAIQLTLSDQCGVFALIRIKNLKHINYKLGFDTGDEVMRLIAEEIRELVPDRHDKLYRLNGVDFAIVLHQVEIESATTQVTNIKQSIQAKFAQREWPIRLTSACVEFNDNTRIQILLSTADSLADHAMVDPH
jgi:diguanylate cyclase (GGDEF)-like protein